MGVRLSVDQRESRRKSRKLKKLLSSIPSHKHPLALALIEIAVDVDKIEARRALDRLNGLLVDDVLPDHARLQGITSAIRLLDGDSSLGQGANAVRSDDESYESNAVAAGGTTARRARARKTQSGSCVGVSSGSSHGLGLPSTRSSVLSALEEQVFLPSTPPGHGVSNRKPPPPLKYSAQRDPVIDERLPCKPNPWSSKELLSEFIYKNYNKYKPAGLVEKFDWDKLSKKEQKNWVLLSSELWSVLECSWPKDLPTRLPLIPPGSAECPSCDGTGSVPRALRIALEWFLARRAKKAKLDGRSRIDPGDWGYEEIAAVELCSYYRDKGEPMVEVTLEESVSGFQDQSPTRLHPSSIFVSRYPTDLQIEKGQLEVREKHKTLSGSQRNQLKKMRKIKIRGPILVEGKEGWDAEWVGRGIACEVTHLKSGLKAGSESFSNFKQNLSSAEIKLEKLVAEWFEEQEKPAPARKKKICGNDFSENLKNQITT